MEKYVIDLKVEDYELEEYAEKLETNYGERKII